MDAQNSPAGRSGTALVRRTIEGSPADTTSPAAISDRLVAEGDPPSGEPLNSRPARGALVRRLLTLAWQHRGLCLNALVAQVLLLAAGLAGLGLTGLALDVLRHAVDPAVASPRFPFGFVSAADASPMRLLAIIAGLMLGVALFNGALRYWATVSAARLTQQIVVRLRGDVYDKLQQLSFRFFDTHDSGSIINRVAGDVPSIASFIDAVVLRVIVVVLALSVYLGYMLSVHVWLTVACLAVLPLLWVGAVTFSRTVQPEYFRSSRLLDQLILTFSESVQGIHVTKGFARQREAIAQFGRANRAVHDQKGKIFWTVSLFQPAMGLLTQISMLVLLAWGGRLVIRGELPLGTGLFVFVGLLNEFSNQVGQITNIANSVQSCMAGAHRVFEVLDAKPEIASPPGARHLARARGAITFEHVSFAYRPGETVLHDVSFEIRPGECVAVVGATGSGKSSLLQLVSRFYDPSSGRVLVDGIDVSCLDLDDLRRNVGVVFQEAFLFSDTAAANIAFGRPCASTEEVDRAARIAAAREFLRELPQQYESILTERGNNLSGGQRQRLTIARAMLIDPPILLLDDATAAVDPETEHEIRRAIDAAMQGRTTIMVTQRVSALRKADKILVLDGGRLLRCGTHEQLLKSCEPYRRLVALQADPAENARPPLSVGAAA